MNVHIANVDINSRTGPNTFAKRLIQGLEARGHNSVGFHEDYDAYLAFINAVSLPRRDALIVQRLDGVWMKPEDFLPRNEVIKKTYEMSDFIIWQSQFDKDMSQFHWGPKLGEVINNGIDIRKSIVTNSEIIRLRTKFDKVFVSSANWRRHKRLKENIELFRNYERSRPDLSCALIVLGDAPDYADGSPRKNVFFTGSLPHEICLQVFSIADAMIHLAYLDHCPNTVVESISQDCPVICASSGGTHELVRENGLVIQEEKVFNFKPHDYTNPPDINIEDATLFDKIDQLIAKKSSLRKDYIDIGTIVDKYIEVLGRTKNEK